MVSKVKISIIEEMIQVEWLSGLVKWKNKKLQMKLKVWINITLPKENYKQSIINIIYITTIYKLNKK
jgi:hypothetical protein